MASSMALSTPKQGPKSPNIVTFMNFPSDHIINSKENDNSTRIV